MTPPAKEPTVKDPKVAARVAAFMRVGIALDRLAQSMKDEPEPRKGDDGRATPARRVG